MVVYVDLALREQTEGRSLPFVILRQPEGLVIGSTRFMEIALEHRRLEIGATWITRDFQRTGANLEAKLLLLSHAFEILGVQKVVFKTEVLNEQSRRAIGALGAVEEGTFRKHLLTDDGRSRDMMYFSILDDEWPKIRERLVNRLSRHRP
jgi:RimJ/RimL family protein N-acetyltransferase